MNDHTILGRILREDFELFLAFVFDAISGEGKYVHNWHIDAIKYQLDRVERGENRRLIVTMPPRHLKTTAVTIAWIAWMLGHNPALRIIAVTYGSKLAEKYAIDTLKVIDSWWYMSAFPNLVLTRRTLLDIETSMGGGRLGTSLGGTLTGRGGDYIVIDDPTKSAYVTSEAVRDSDKAWLFNTLMTRLNDPAKGAIILVMQRLHQGDLAGELIERGGWHELKLPAIATQNERIPIGEGRFYRRRTGHPLHPERQSLTDIYERRHEMGSYNFAAQHQQNPVPAFGNLVRAIWLKTYGPDFNPALKPGKIVQSWDTASKDNPYNDYSVCITAHVHGRDMRVLHVFRAKLTDPRLRYHAERLAREFKADTILIENQSSGLHLIDDLWAIKDLPNPIPRRPEGDKEARIGRVSAMIEAGNLMLPIDAHWLPEFTSEILGFSNAKHDDCADALSQLGIWAIDQTNYPGLPIAGPELMELGYNGGDLDDDIDPWAVL